MVTHYSLIIPLILQEVDTINTEVKIVWKNFVKTYNPRQNIWNKIELSSKTEPEQKRLVSIFACF